MLALAVLVSGCGGGGGGKTASHYSVAALQIPTPYIDSCANSIDNSGRILGLVHYALGGYTCIWSSNPPTPTVREGLYIYDTNESWEGISNEIGRLPYVVNVTTGAEIRTLDLAQGVQGQVGAQAINDSGTCVGSGCNSIGSSRAIIWNDDGVSSLLHLPNGYDQSEAIDVNNSGMIAGSVRRSSDEEWRAAVWNSDGTFRLVFPLPPGFHRSLATHINDAGEVLVDLDFEKDNKINYFTCPGHAVYQPDGYYRLLTRPDDQDFSTSDMNGRGQVVGILSDYRGVLWNPDGSYELLPAFKAGIPSKAQGINDNGVIVGASSDGAGHECPLIWTPIN